jgi:hypothetical protein
MGAHNYGSGGRWFESPQLYQRSGQWSSVSPLIDLLQQQPGILFLLHEGEHLLGRHGGGLAADWITELYLEAQIHRGWF